MFYVGDVLWMEEGERWLDIPNLAQFSGCIRWPNGTKNWYDQGKLQSFQDPVTKEWMPARIYPHGTKMWYNQGKLQSFQDPVTKELMPGIVYLSGFKKWFDKGWPTSNPSNKTV